MMDSVIQFEGTIYENGYGLIAQKVMRDKSLPKQSRLIYSYMCSFASVGKNGERTAFPSVSLQCHELDMSEDTYYKWRKPLIERGFIKITKQRKEGAKFDNNVYSILAIPVEPEPEQEEEKDQEKPYPKNSGTEEPYPNFSGTENPSTENKGTIITSSNIISFNKEEEEEEGGQNSRLIQFLLSKDIKEYHAKRFEDRLLQNGITGFTYDDVLEAMKLSFGDFEDGICNDPYLWAVGKLERLLDAKKHGKKLKRKSNRSNYRKRGTVEDVVPGWYLEGKHKEKPPVQKENEPMNDEQKKVAEMLKKYKES